MNIFPHNKMTSTPLPVKIQGKKHLLSPVLLLCVLLLFVFWQLLHSSFIQIFKSISAGFLFIYYTFELIYFDSLTPGIQPASPLSPPIIRTVSGHTLHLNYALSIVIGLFVTLFVNNCT